MDNLYKFSKADELLKIFEIIIYDETLVNVVIGDRFLNAVEKACKKGTFKLNVKDNNDSFRLSFALAYKVFHETIEIAEGKKDRSGVENLSCVFEAMNHEGMFLAMYVLKKTYNRTLRELFIETPNEETHAIFSNFLREERLIIDNRE